VIPPSSPLGVVSPDLSPLDDDDEPSTRSPAGIDEEEGEEGLRVRPFISVARAVEGFVDSVDMMLRIDRPRV
jgi:hypothetical protein